MEDLFLAFSKFNQHHDNKGRFASTGGSGYNPGVALASSKSTAWNEQPVDLKAKLSKQEAGALGERIAIAYLQSKGFSDARPLNQTKNNYAVDMAMDHKAIEIKTGLVSNGTSAQQWRATIGQPGKAEAAWLKKASPEAKAAWNKKKQDAILARKEAAVKEVERTLGGKVGRETVALIVNPDTKTADIYRFNGFHLRVGWKGEQAKSGYVGTFKYSEARVKKSEVRDAA